MIRLTHASINHLFRVAILHTHDKSQYDDQGTNVKTQSSLSNSMEAARDRAPRLHKLRKIGSKPS